MQSLVTSSAQCGGGGMCWALFSHQSIWKPDFWWSRKPTWNKSTLHLARESEDLNYPQLVRVISMQVWLKSTSHLFEGQTSLATGIWWNLLIFPIQYLLQAIVETWMDRTHFFLLVSSTGISDAGKNWCPVCSPSFADNSSNCIIIASHHIILPHFRWWVKTLIPFVGAPWRNDSLIQTGQPIRSLDPGSLGFLLPLPWWCGEVGGTDTWLGSSTQLSPNYLTSWSGWWW